MSEARLPARDEVSALVRLVQTAGGFAAVLAKGEPTAGTILVVTCCNNRNHKAWERMPQASGERAWECVRSADGEPTDDFAPWLERRHSQDPDLWIVELDIAEGERFIGMKGSAA